MLSTLYLPNINHVSLRLANIVQLQLFKTFPDQFMTNSSYSEVIWGGHLQNSFFSVHPTVGKGGGGRGEKGSFAILWNNKGSRLIVLPFPFFYAYFSFMTVIWLTSVAGHIVQKNRNVSYYRKKLPVCLDSFFHTRSWNRLA